MKMNENQIRSLIAAQVLENLGNEGVVVWDGATVEQLAIQAFMLY